MSSGRGDSAVKVSSSKGNSSRQACRAWRCRISCFSSSRFQAVLDVFQVAILGGAVNLVSRDGMAQMLQMHAYLVHAACFRNAPDQGQRPLADSRGALYTECRDAFLSGGMYCLFYPDAAFPYFPLPQDGGRADRFLPFLAIP